MTYLKGFFQMNTPINVKINKLAIEQPTMIPSIVSFDIRSSPLFGFFVATLEGRGPKTEYSYNYTYLRSPQLYRVSQKKVPT